jgi:hypothetical protein
MAKTVPFIADRLVLHQTIRNLPGYPALASAYPALAAYPALPRPGQAEAFFLLNLSGGPVSRPEGARKHVHWVLCLA